MRSFGTRIQHGFSTLVLLQVRGDLEAHAQRALTVSRPLRVVISNLLPNHVETVQARVRMLTRWTLHPILP